MEKRDIKTRGSIMGIVLIVAVVAIALFAGYYWGAKKDGTILETIQDIKQEFATTTSQTATTSKSSTGTQDKTPAKEVVTPKKPIGKLYTDPNNDFTFRYPENYIYEKEPLVPGEMGGYALRFYETGADKNDVTKSFTIAKRHLETYQLVIEGDVGCSYDVATHSFKIASTYSSRTECNSLSSNKNKNNTIYFSSWAGNTSVLESSNSFISEQKDLVVAMQTTREQGSSLPISLQNIIIDSVSFK
jgi:hypothetical protein